MSIGIILVSHGDLAMGVKHSAEMVFGRQEKTEVVTFVTEQGPKDVHEAIVSAIETFSTTDEILILADLRGGTPYNQALLIINELENRKIGLIAGLSLPMLIQAYTERLSENNSLSLMMAHVIEEAKKGVSVPSDSVQPGGVNPKEEVHIEDRNRDGERFKINLVRIDSRLLHGQVATAWTPDSKANRIIVVSDTVSKDEVRKKLIEQAAPLGVKANVVPIKKMVEAANSPILNGVQALLLFENPQDLLKTVEGGVDIKIINVGQMVNKTGKTQISHTLSLDKEDVRTFERLRAKGIEFDVRKVPSDSKQNLFGLIEKATIK